MPTKHITLLPALLCLTSMLGNMTPGHGSTTTTTPFETIPSSSSKPLKQGISLEKLNANTVVTLSDDGALTFTDTGKGVSIGQIQLPGDILLESFYFMEGGPSVVVVGVNNYSQLSFSKVDLTTGVIKTDVSKLTVFVLSHSHMAPYKDTLYVVLNNLESKKHTLYSVPLKDSLKNDKITPILEAVDGIAESIHVGQDGTIYVGGDGNNNQGFLYRIKQGESSLTPHRYNLESQHSFHEIFFDEQNNVGYLFSSAQNQSLIKKINLQTGQYIGDAFTLGHSFGNLFLTPDGKHMLMIHLNVSSDSDSDTYILHSFNVKQWDDAKTPELIGLTQISNVGGGYGNFHILPSADGGATVLWKDKKKGWLAQRMNPSTAELTGIPTSFPINHSDILWNGRVSSLSGQFLNMVHERFLDTKMSKIKVHGDVGITFKTDEGEPSTTTTTSRDTEEDAPAE